MSRLRDKIGAGLRMATVNDRIPSAALTLITAMWVAAYLRDAATAGAVGGALFVALNLILYLMVVCRIWREQGK